MCYDKHGKIGAKAFDCLHNSLFGIVVEGAGGFVEDDNIGLLVECTGDADALALASGEADASFANVGFIFFWPGFDDVGNLSLLSGLLDSCMIDFIWSNSKGYVFFDGAVGEKDGLRDVGNMGLPCTIVTCNNGLCIYFKSTFGW